MKYQFIHSFNYIDDVLPENPEGTQIDDVPPREPRRKLYWWCAPQRTPKGPKLMVCPPENPEGTQIDSIDDVSSKWPE